MNAWTHELAAILALIAFRALPFAGFAVLAPRFGILVKAGALLGVGALLWATDRLASDVAGALLSLPAVYAYMAVLTSTLPPLSRALHAGWLSRFSLAALLVAAFLVLPASVAPGWMTLPFVVMGWDCALKAFSYCVDDTDLDPELTLRELYFFMLVSPTLVLAERGEPAAPAACQAGFGRLAFGFATFVAETALRFAALKLPYGALGSGSQVGQSAMLGFAYYLGHSALASVQIGLMLTIGYRVPERYVYPLLSPSPIEFWRRWNTWVGSWARRYVFAPVSIRLRRSVPRIPSLVAQGIAGVAAFVAIGALHDVIRVAGSLRHAPLLTLAATGMFAAFGVTTMLWSAVDRALRRRRAADSTRARATRVRFALSYALFLPYALGMFWLAQSALAGQGLPRPLPALVWR